METKVLVVEKETGRITYMLTVAGDNREVESVVKKLKMNLNLNMFEVKTVDSSSALDETRKIYRGM
jgi:hypothetical protein